MDFDRKLRENIASQLPIFLSDDHLKPCMKDELFPFEASSQKGYLQDFHNIDQFHANGTSSNHMLGSQNTCYQDPFDPYPYGSSTNLDFYECKPFADQNGGHGTVMDNFQSGGYVNLSQRNPINILGSNHNHSLFNCQDMKPVNYVVPDEVSSVTAETGCYTKVGMNKNRAAASTKKLYKKRKSNVVKGQWTIEEDRLLIQLVDQYGIRKWSHIAQMLPGRIGKQCRERWHNHLRPDIKKDSWSEEEDRVLIQAHAEIGNKWAEIAKKLPGRTENSIKNHWNATKRRQYSKRKCRSKYPKGTLLQEYIKNLKLDTLKMDYRKKTTKEAMSGGNNAINATTQTHNMDFCPSDRLVPNFDFNDEVPDFSFDGKMFEDGCSIDSLFDELPATAPVVDKKSFEMEMPIDVAAMTMEYEVKKELDLVEMISQVNL